MSIYGKPMQAVNFICSATEAQAVSLVGDFNNWDPKANPLKQLADKAWTVQVTIKHGHHRYAFIVDNVLTLDPRGMGITRNDKGERVSMVAVS